MKRFLAALGAVILCVSMTGCSGLDYIKASRLYKDAQYAQALPLYESLGEFADSAKMAEICSQKADYTAAEAYLASKDYEAALPLYEGLGMYADSPVKAITCRYENGRRYLENGKYEEAIHWLEPLGNYEDSAYLTRSARWQWLCRQRHTLVLSDEEGEFRALSLEPNNSIGAIRILLERKGHLLGLPYDTEFTLTLDSWSGKEIAYTVSCRSESDMTIEESAAGVVDLASFTAGKPLQTSEFTQIVTDAEGNQTTSNDVAQAIIVQAVMLEAQEQITTYLPQLLENSGVDITMEDLGF